MKRWDQVADVEHVRDTVAGVTTEVSYYSSINRTENKWQVSVCQRSALFPDGWILYSEFHGWLWVAKLRGQIMLRRERRIHRKKLAQS